ncbi:uncharacterized protein LOC131878582 isoform X2 [Tigriopus californicus]|uniref:uncharacterized protein LOC131878582 isoform X2 n=1 Tax=Tigriopus californicus TaxID=6832 RepID=UPI0027DA9050|nr:uncharacterized protein LOC131878582 isoform X2 [Tigriopus californicus]
MHPPPSDNYRLIKNQINGTDIRKPKSVHPSRRKSSFHSAMVAPKSEPLRRKVMQGGNFEMYASREALCASTMDLRQPPRFEAPPPPPLSREDETRMKKNQVHASRNSLYKEGSNGNLEYSEYGELRAIVRRIEEQKLNHLSRNNTFVSRNQSFSTGKSPHLNRKRMYFDYVPSSVMRSNSHHGGQGPPRPNNLGVPSQSTQTLPHSGSLTMNNSTLPPRHLHHHPNHPPIRHPDHFSPDRSSGSSHFPGVSPDSSGLSASTSGGTLLNSRLDESNTASNSPSSSMDNRKGRRNSHKASTPSSSLLIKRSEDAPVTLKGWLYKQGSDGLMLWKKRWFVLSEYCLFYYRSPEEDKVSGSILLPSYKISPVAKEDAVFRRFCFKAEHQNMRTYYFATDTKEAMIQWMNALSLASIMQTPSTRSSAANVTTTPTSPTASTMNGNHLAQSRSSVAVMNNMRTPVTHHQYPTQVHQMYSPNGNAYQYHGEPSPSSPTSPEGLENGRQPLYANAPPKPRRLTNTREDSPDRFEDEELSPTYHQQMYSRQNPGKVPLRSHTPGERMMYPQAQHYPYQQATLVQNLQQQQRHTQTPGEPIYNGNNVNNEVANHNRQGGPTIRHRLPQERRTPEAYGRSHFNMMNQNTSQNYEDVFRNRNTPGYPPPQGRNYPPPPVPQQQAQLPPLPQQPQLFQGYQYQHQVPHQPYHPQQPQPVTPQYQPHELPQQRQPREVQRQPGQPQQKVPRPHSADFLELDRNVVAVPTQSSGGNNLNTTQYQSQTQTPHHYLGNHVRRKQNPQPPRPKSSVDPRMFDSSWSTEHYAEQMRNHASTYATGTPQQTPRSQSRASIHSKSHLMPDNHLQSQPRTSQTRLYPPQTSHTSDSQVDSSEEVSRYFPTPSPRKPVQGTTTYQNLPDNSAIVTRQYPQYQARLETVTPNRLSEQYHGSNGSDYGTGEFRRSASARLHRNKKNYPEMLNNSDLGPEDNKKKEQREESMKRLLEWKQRMLQSPLTRKSSRNASRTQTPTNSNSPVPSLGHDSQFRQKVLDELEKQSGKSSTPGNSSSNTTSERRLSRKGSGASRSSRSRSSPRIANRPNTSSSDEDKQQSLESSRQSRKKSRPQSEKRSRNPSRESRRSSCHVGSSTDQPEYINISCLEPALSPKRGQDLQVRETVVKAEWRKRAIGPDDWYSDDFNYDNAKNSFSEDPLLSGQYSHLLDLKYHNQTAGAFVQEASNMVQDNVPMRSKPRRTLKDQGRSVTWHADKFKDFQIMGKQNKEEVLLTIEADSNLTGSLQRPNKGLEHADKIHWSPVQAFEEIKRMNEAPPTNLVKDRLQKFQSEERLQKISSSERKISSKSSVSGSAFSLEDINAALEDDNVFESTQKTSQQGTEQTSLVDSREIKAVELSETKALIERQRKRREKFFETVLSDSKDDITTDDDLDEVTKPGKPRERKRSVRELLSDFEKKSKEIHDQEIQEGENDDLSGSRRRVFSDTETMMFETSSDDVMSEDANKPVDKHRQPDPFTPEVPPRTPKGPKPRAWRQENQYLPMSPPSATFEQMQPEGQYLPMTPSKAKISTATQSRSSITSSSASRGSTQSILTPTEMLIQAHNRTPSQSLVIDHLQKEFSANIAFQEGTYVPMLDDHESMKVPSRDQLPKRPILAPPHFQEPKFASKPKESPRYIEIDDPDEEDQNHVIPITEMSHYEYLYKARSATPLHYEAVYQEISDDESPKEVRTTKALPQTPIKPEAKAPQAKLPDIIGNTPTHRGHSSSDADDEGGVAHLSHSRAKSNASISDSFKPASFFLNPPKRSLSQDIRTDHSHPERRTSSGSLSARELPMTPIERRKSAEDLHRTLEGSMRSSISSLDSAGKRKTILENIEEERRGSTRGGRREAVTVLPPQPEVGYQNEEGDQLEHSSLPPLAQISLHQGDQKPRSGSVVTDPNSSLSPRSPKVPYYVSDLNESQATIDRAKAIDELHLSMELLDAQTNEHLAHKSNDDMLHRIRRSAAPTPVNEHGYPGGPVARSQSLEGLLGDSPGTPRDSVQVQMQVAPPPSSANLPPRGREAPPPPPNVPPLDLRSPPTQAQAWTKEVSNDSVEEDDDPVWRESLRRASAKHRARSADPRNQNVVHPVRQGQHDPSFYWDERDQRFYKIKDQRVPPPHPQSVDPSFLDQSLPVPIDSRAQGSGRHLPSEPLNSMASIDNPDSGIYENADFFPDSSASFPSFTSAPHEVFLTNESQTKTTQYVEANTNNNAPLRVRQQTGPPPGRRRTSSASRKDSDTLKQKVRGNLLDITAQDLLGKSHEELVLMLIHLRRQGAALKEAIDSTKAEMQSVAHHPNDTDENQKLLQDLNCHIRELEDQHARAHPVITLVDNMVKLGSLYRGPADAPLSHRIRNLPTSSSSSSGVSSGYDSKSQRKTPFDEDKVKMAEQEKAVVQDTLESSLEQTKRTIPNGSEEFDAFNKEQEMLENELRRVHGQLQTSQKKLDENSSEHSRWEHDILFLRQTLQQSVTRNMQYGISQSAETLAIEGELAQVQQRASELHRERQSLMNDIQKLSSRQDCLSHEYRSSNSTTDKKVVKKSKPVESEPRNYENVQIAAPAPLPEKESSDMMELTLGDISEADDRVKKFYGIIPKDNKAAEIKTVRMVKRDSKERSVIKSSRSYVDENGRLVEVEVDDGESTMTTPPMLPRGNYGPNMHDFLQTSTNGNDAPKKRGEIFSSGSLPRNYESSSSAESSGNFTNSPAGRALISQVNGTSASTTAVNGGLYSKPNFKLGEYNRKKSKDSSERPASGLSAHERLFGSSRESSMSPPMSPMKNSVLTGSSDSGVSPIMSPIFKSATAKQIAEEVGKHGPPGGTKYRRKSKKRSHTITSGNPAIMEALNQHDTKQASNRARDDIDMERILRPRTNAPDVIKSALDKKDMKINSTTIDNLFGVPEKILIPERYIPDTDMDNITQEERQVRLKKADSIRRMLADTGAAPILGGLTPKQKENMEDEKKEREHILALNQVLARQVMEKSRIVAVRALANHKFSDDEGSEEDATESTRSYSSSPTQPLPLFQQRESMLQ